MHPFSFQKTKIDGLTLIQPFLSADSRGYLLKSFEKGLFTQHGIDMQPYEELTSCSSKGTLRGLHFQRNFSQDKIVRVLSGRLFDVAVDLRKDSPTFGQWESFDLSAENHRMLYIPKGFAHGFLALEDNSALNYLCGDRYDAASEDGILWSDPALSIPWPFEQVESVVLSPRDERFQTLAQFQQSYGALSVEN